MYIYSLAFHISDMRMNRSLILSNYSTGTVGYGRIMCLTLLDTRRVDFKYTSYNVITR